MSQAKSHCDEFLETWLTACDEGPPGGLVEQKAGDATAGDATTGDASEVHAVPAEHLASCTRCAEMVAAFSQDQQLLRRHFASIPIPAQPTLALREPLNAASGHPRRVSLNVLPFLLLLLLGFLLMIALFGYLLDRIQQGG